MFTHDAPGLDNRGLLILEFLAEAEHDRLVRQAKEGHKRNLGTMLSMKKVLGLNLIRLGQKLSPRLEEA